MQAWAEEGRYGGRLIACESKTMLGQKGRLAGRGRLGRHGEPCMEGRVGR